MPRGTEMAQVPYWSLSDVDIARNLKKWVILRLLFVLIDLKNNAFFTIRPKEETINI
jgi:hypothetical protein